MNWETSKGERGWRTKLLFTAWMMIWAVVCPAAWGDDSDQPDAESQVSAPVIPESEDGSVAELLGNIAEGELLEPGPEDVADTTQVPPEAARFQGPEGMVEADLTAPVMLEMIENAAAGMGYRASDMVVTLVHNGERITPELKWIIGHIKRAGLNVKVFRKGNKKDTNKAKNIRDEKALSQKFLELYWNRDQDPELAKIVNRTHLNEGHLKAVWKNFSTRLKVFFGLHNGVSFAMYPSTHNGFRRPLRQQATEVGLGIAVSTFISFIAYESLVQQAKTNPEIAVTSGVLATWMMNVMWSYLKRPNNIFHTQGKNYYDDARKAIDTNRWFFYVSNLKDSILTSLIIKSAIYGGIENLDGDVVSKILRNSATGLFAKILPELYIAKHQRSGDHVHDTESKRHSEWTTIGLNTGLSALMGGLKIADLLGSSHPLSQAAQYLYLALGIAGLVYEGQKHFFANKEPETWGERMRLLKKQMKKNIRNWSTTLGIREAYQCKTSILLRGMNEEERELLGKQADGKATREEVLRLQSLGFI